MTSEPDAYVWVWLPGATDPVPAGAMARTGRSLAGDEVLGFTYGRSYLRRDGRLSLFAPELPLGDGVFDPADPRPVYGQSLLAANGQQRAGLPALPPCWPPTADHRPDAREAPEMDHKALGALTEQVPP